MNKIELFYVRNYYKMDSGMDVCEDNTQFNDEGYNDMEDDGYDADMDGSWDTDSEDDDSMEIAMLYLRI